MYTITINTEPMARGAMGMPFITVNPIVRTKKNVPTNSVTYRLMMSSLQLSRFDSLQDDSNSMPVLHPSTHDPRAFVTQFADRQPTRQAPEASPHFFKRPLA
jgi:hypothetical protein